MEFSESSLEELIKDIKANLPEFLRARDLIACGLFKTRSDVSWAKRRGQAPPCIILSQHKTIYPRTCLIEWLKKKIEMANKKTVL